MTYEVLLYYLYTHFPDPHEVAEWQRALCQELGLTGRIIVAEEGINGTVEGALEHTQRYVEAFSADPRLAGTTFKRSEGTGSAFPKLSVKVRSEIVSAHLGEKDVDPTQVTGKYLSADELHEWIRSQREFYIVDMRNDYEHAVGRFAGSILPSIHHFRELPRALPELEHLRGKTVLTVCTGGVRCEKASGFLLENGFADVYQLEGGIVTYMEKYPNQGFEGSLYVFDGRITMGFNREDPERVIVGRCELCGDPSENYINCADDRCHRHFICCAACAGEGESVRCGKVCAGVRAVVA